MNLTNIKQYQSCNMKDIVDMFKDENKYKMPHKFSFITLEEF